MIFNSITSGGGNETYYSIDVRGNISPLSIWVPEEGGFVLFTEPDIRFNFRPGDTVIFRYDTSSSPGMGISISIVSEFTGTYSLSEIPIYYFNNFYVMGFTMPDWDPIIVINDPGGGGSGM